MSKESNDEIIIRSPFKSKQIPNITVGEYCAEKVSKYGEKILLIDAKSDEKLTANELIAKAHAVASALLKRQLTFEDIICFYSTNNVPYIISLFGIYFLGNTFTPSRPTNNAQEIESQLINSGTTIIFTSMANSEAIRKVINTGKTKLRLVIVLDGDDDGDGEYEHFVSFKSLICEGNNDRLQKIPHFNVNPRDDIFAIYYTSGTTGVPKGAMIMHYSFIPSLIPPIIFTGFETIKDDDIISGHFAFGHVGGNLMIASCLSNGLPIVVHKNMDTHKIAAAIEKYKVTVMMLFPELWHQLFDDSFSLKYDLTSLKCLVIGGFPFPTQIGFDLIKKYNLRSFRNVYGMTECMNIILNDDSEYIPGSCGRLAPDVEMKICDIITGKCLGPNEDGEICIRNPAMFKGYLNNPDATRGTIGTNGWMRTGDIGHYDHNGRLFITDRIKEMIKYKIYSVPPVPIELLLQTHDAIQEAAVIGVPHELDGQWVRAYVIRNKGMDITAEEIQKFVSDNKSDPNHLRGGVVFVDHIPRTIVGKIDRQYYKKLVSGEIIKSSY